MLHIVQRLRPRAGTLLSPDLLSLKVRSPLRSPLPAMARSGRLGVREWYLPGEGVKQTMLMNLRTGGRRGLVKLFDVLVLLAGGTLLLYGVSVEGGFTQPDLLSQSFVVGGGAEFVLGLCRLFASVTGH